jgi:hypothetical protein
MTDSSISGPSRHPGGGQGPRRLRGEDKARALARARAWHARMKPVFDRMDAEGAFADSPGLGGGDHAK